MYGILRRQLPHRVLGWLAGNLELAVLANGLFGDDLTARAFNASSSSAAPPTRCTRTTTTSLLFSVPCRLRLAWTLDFLQRPAWTDGHGRRRRRMPSHCIIGGKRATRRGERPSTATRWRLRRVVVRSEKPRPIQQPVLMVIDDPIQSLSLANYMSAWISSHELTRYG
jgi:hypothetical protein